MTTTLPAFLRPTLEILSIEQIKSALAQSDLIVHSDPMLARAELPIQKTFHPLGFPLEISTNSEEVIVAAEEIWGSSTGLFQTPIIRMHVGVTDGISGECPPVPTSRIRGHLCSIIANGENFAISDMAQGFSYAWVTRNVISFPGFLGYYFLEASALCQIATRFTTPVHAGFVTLEGCGVLLCGDSGAGKSTLSYACARAGWTYITDDASFLINGREDGLIVGDCRMFRFRPSAQDLFPELQGRPISKRVLSGKPSIEVTAASFPQIKTASTATARYLVFLNRSKGKKQELACFPAEVARIYMLQPTTSMPELLSLQEGSIDRLLEHGAFELCYTDLDWAVERLVRLAREGQ